MIPSVDSPRIDCHVSHPPPTWLSNRKQIEVINETLSDDNPSWNIQRQMKVQFPETRLIQYDCGQFKLDYLHKVNSCILYRNLVCILL